MTVNIEGHQYDLLFFNVNPYRVPNFQNITKVVLRSLLAGTAVGTFAFRKSAELWVRGQAQVYKIDMEIKETAIGMLFDGYLYDELIREYSLKYSLMEYYDCEYANICSRIRKVPQGIGRKEFSDALRDYMA